LPLPNSISEAVLSKFGGGTPPSSGGRTGGIAAQPAE
jgi:hypothetical protein